MERAEKREEAREAQAVKAEEEKEKERKRSRTQRGTRNHIFLRVSAGRSLWRRTVSQTRKGRLPQRYFVGERAKCKDDKGKFSTDITRSDERFPRDASDQ